MKIRLASQRSVSFCLPECWEERCVPNDQPIFKIFILFFALDLFTVNFWNINNKASYVLSRLSFRYQRGLFHYHIFLPLLLFCDLFPLYRNIQTYYCQISPVRGKSYSSKLCFKHSTVWGVIGSICNPSVWEKAGKWEKEPRQPELCEKMLQWLPPAPSTHNKRTLVLTLTEPF